MKTLYERNYETVLMTIGYIILIDLRIQVNMTSKMSQRIAAKNRGGRQRPMQQSKQWSMLHVLSGMNALSRGWLCSERIKPGSIPQLNLLLAQPSLAMGPTTTTGIVLLATLAITTRCSRGSRLHYENPNSLGNELQLLDIYLNKRSDTNNRNAENSKSVAGLWFGPRLGRKKRASEDKEVVLKLLQEGPWAVVAMKDGSNRRQVNFIPRLGRESEEDLFLENMIDMNYPRAPTATRSESSSGTYVGPSFTPRLGRLAPNEVH